MKTNISHHNPANSQHKRPHRNNGRVPDQVVSNHQCLSHYQHISHRRLDINLWIFDNNQQNHLFHEFLMYTLMFEVKKKEI